MKKGLLNKLMAVVICLALLLSACGSSNSGNVSGDSAAEKNSGQSAAGAENAMDQSADKDGGETSKEDSQTGGKDSSEAAASQAGEDDEDMAEINVMYINTGLVTKYDDVESAVNAITEPKINVHVTLEPVSIGDYIQQLTLKISSNEKLDALLTIPAGSARFTSMVSQNQLQPLDDLLEEYGQGILKTVPEIYLKAGMLNQTTYAVPCYADKVDTFYLFMRKDIVDKYNIDTNAIDSIADVENIFDIIKEKEPNLVPVVPGMTHDVLTKSNMFVYDTFEGAELYDNLIDNMAIIMLNGDTTKVVNYYETEGFKKTVEVMKRWYDKGYVYKDTATNTEAGTDLILQDKGFSYFSGSDGQFASINASCGREMVAVPINIVPTTTSLFTNWTWAIPTCATEEEGAMKFINLLFTDAELINVLNFGIEGVHYEEKSDGTIGFPEGVTSDSSGYYLNATWLFGNQFLSKVWEGNDPDSRRIALDKQENAVWSPAIGFTVDTANLENEISALTNVVAEYRGGLCAGVLDPETALPEFIDKLNTSGMKELIAEVQRQYDAWMASN